MEAIKRFGVRFFGGVQRSGDTKMVGVSKLEDDEMMKKLAGTGISCLDGACDEEKSGATVALDENVVACEGKSASVLDRTVGAEHTFEHTFDNVNTRPNHGQLLSKDLYKQDKDVVGGHKNKSEAGTTKRTSKVFKVEAKKRTKLVKRDSLTDGVRCSPRIAHKRAFSTFKNDVDTPIYVDDSGTETEFHDIMKEKGKRAKVDTTVKVSEKEAKKQKGKVKEQVVKDRGINNPKVCVVDNNSDDDFMPIKRLTSDYIPAPRTPGFYKFTGQRILPRNTPKNLCDYMSKLSKKQIEVVKKLGFGSMCLLKLRNIPTELAFWLVKNYDPTSNTLNTGNTVVTITPSLVHRVLGIPNGPDYVEEIFKPNTSDPVVAEFREQFGDDSLKIKLTRAVDVFEKNKGGGREFVLNFLVVFNTVIIETMQSSTINQRFLTSITTDSVVSRMNWCGYLIHCLKRTRNNWIPARAFNGPLTFLAALYAYLHEKEKYDKDITQPVIASLDDDTLNGLENVMATKLFKERLTKGEVSGIVKDVEANRRGKRGRKGAVNVKKSVDMGKCKEKESMVNDESARKGKESQAMGDRNDGNVMEGNRNEGVRDNDGGVGKIDTDVGNKVNMPDQNIGIDNDIGDVVMIDNDVVLQGGGVGHEGLIAVMPDNVLSVDHNSGELIEGSDFEHISNWVMDSQDIQDFKDECVTQTQLERNAEGEVVLRSCTQYDVVTEIVDVVNEDVRDGNVEEGDINGLASNEQTQHEKCVEEVIKVKIDAGRKNLSEIEHLFEIDILINKFCEAGKCVADCIRVASIEHPESDAIKIKKKDWDLTLQKMASNLNTVDVGNLSNAGHGVELEHDMDKEIRTMATPVFVSPGTIEAVEKATDSYLKEKFVAEEKGKVERTVYKSSIFSDDEQQEHGNKEDEVTGNVGNCAVNEEMFKTPEQQIPVNLTSVVEMEDNELVGRNKRKRKIAEVLKSPYVKRRVDLGKPKTLTEIFTSKYGGSISRVMMESLIPGMSVHPEVVNGWAVVQNYEDQFRSTGAVSRLFSLVVDVRVYGGRMGCDARLALFRPMMDKTLKAAGLKSLKGIDLVFIPYLFGEGYYLLCFKLSKPEIYLLDNNKNLDADHNNIYFGWPELLRGVFAGYLKEKKHPIASKIKGSEIKCLQMPWMDTDNFVDSGVYVMRHMETFEGTEVRYWKCLLSNEGMTRQMELNDLRRKYVAKMVLHDINTEKMRVEVEMRSYMDNDVNVRRAIRDAAFKKIKGRLKVLEKNDLNKGR
ncbi:hypothetical protein SSX86_013097 [Deinandra increscens subsp. villosa]|uniref:Ubiquitin-like protease family profile domain-containing protein n=1 Tax=Deinandra increscens subsp. villosa TaxID=3103831 RepID=A0AAP0D5G8_9ASTR